MKNMNKPQPTIDAIAEAKKDKGFLMRAKAAMVRVRFAAEVYKVRKERNLNQQDLAKEAGTTQRVVSNIESGDVNVGIELFVRVSEVLNFDGWNLSTIFDKPFYFKFEQKTSSKSENINWTFNNERNSMAMIQTNSNTSMLAESFN